MKIKERHIKKFEAFIQNIKDPNGKDQPKKKKQIEPAPGEDDETQPDEDDETQPNEDESDPIDELKRYFETTKNKLKK